MPTVKANRERGGDGDCGSGHHESPLGFYLNLHPIAVHSTAACDDRHRFGEYGRDFEVAEATYRAAVARWPAARITWMPIAKSYSHISQHPFGLHVSAERSKVSARRTLVFGGRLGGLS